MLAFKNMALLTATSLIASLAAFGQAQQAIPETQDVAGMMKKLIPQQKVLNCADATTDTPWNNSVTFHYSSQGLSIRGTDLSSKSWSVVVPASNVVDCMVWSAPLKGKQQDLLILNADQNGGYSSELTILFFDKNGQPHPWQARGAFAWSDAGIKQVISYNGTTRIIVPARIGDRVSGWVNIHNLYLVSGDGVDKVVGTQDGTAWPVISGNSQLLPGAEHKATETETFALSSNQEQSNLQIASLGDLGTSAPIAYSDGTTSRYPAIVILDSKEGNRQIFLDGDAYDGVQQIVKGKYALVLKGTTCEEEECRPFIMHAKEL